MKFIRSIGLVLVVVLWHAFGQPVAATASLSECAVIGCYDGCPTEESICDATCNAFNSEFGGEECDSHIYSQTSPQCAGWGMGWCDPLELYLCECAPDEYERE